MGVNNKAIQILRGSTGFEPTIANLKAADLQDGQPFYSKKTRQLYIGDDSNDLLNKTTHSYFKPVGAANFVPGSADKSVALLGNETSASGALAIGFGNVAGVTNGLVLGQYNDTSNKAIFQIGNGNGASEGSRLTSFSITNGGVATGSCFVAGNSTLNSGGLTISEGLDKTEITKSLITCKDLKLTGGTTFSSNSSYNPMLINIAGELGKISTVAINPNSKTLDISDYTITLADGIELKHGKISSSDNAKNCIELTGSQPLKINSSTLLFPGSEGTVQVDSKVGDALYVNSDLEITGSGYFSKNIFGADIISNNSVKISDAKIEIGNGAINSYEKPTISLNGTDGTIKAATFYATSDKRLKENITPYTCKKSILDLPVYEFDYTNGGKHTIGCLAQDLQEICPEIVNDGEDGYLSINESKLIYLLLNEVKQLKKRLDDKE